MRSRVVGAVAFVALIAGCGQAPPGTTASPSASTASVVSEPPAEPTTTPAEWASVIAPLRADWIETNLMWELSGCGFNDVAVGDDDCLAVLQSMLTTVEIINMEVGPMANPGARTGYLGTPPAEVARAYEKLYDATKAAWLRATVECPGTTCGEDALMFWLTWTELGDAFTAWEPWM